MTDTAGVRETADEIEAEGVLRAKAAARDADIVVAVADVSAPAQDAPLLDWIAALHSGEPTDSSCSEMGLTSDAAYNVAEISDSAASRSALDTEATLNGAETSSIDAAGLRCEPKGPGGAVSSGGNGASTSHGAGQSNSRYVTLKLQACGEGVFCIIWLRHSWHLDAPRQ